MSEYTKAIQDACNGQPKDRQYTLALLQDIQKEVGFIPEEGLRAAAEHLGCKKAELYSMATFFKALSLDPKGQHLIRLCDGTACHIKGSVSLIDAVERTLGIKPGETTDDGLYSLELVNCLGACALAPVMLIDDIWYGQISAERLPKILEEHPGSINNSTTNSNSNSKEADK